MKLNIQNIGPIEDIDIDIEGITVIAAANDSGKSTIGKTLFSSLKSLNNYKNDIVNFKKSRLKKSFNIILERIENNINDDFSDIGNDFFDINNEFNDEYENEYHQVLTEYLIARDSFISEVLVEPINSLSENKNYSIIINICKHFENAISEEDNEIIKDEIDFISKINTVNKDNLLSNIVASYFYDEFKEDLLNRFSDNDASISLIESNNEIFSVEFLRSNISKAKIKVLKNSQIKDVTYIESPLALDNVKYYREQQYYKNNFMDLPEHGRLQKNDDLLYKLQCSHVAIEPTNTSTIIKLIEAVIGGELNYGKGNIFGKELEFSKKGKKISPKNLANGIKSFAIIELLIKNGVFRDNHLLIIDEPEVHLHPKWQVEYAGILAYLSSKFGLKLLINTHSTYFIEALSLYTKKYNIENSTNYYLLNNKEYGTCSENVTGNLIKIYEQLNGAFGKIDKLELEIFKGER